MNLLYTGATGFLGNNTLKILERNFNVSTLGLSGADFVLDLSKGLSDLSTPFDAVLHAAGEVHSIPRNPKEEQYFFDVNLKGTKNLCHALECSSVPKSFIFVSTVAVYGVEEGTDITEEHPLNPTTPYGQSKLQAEEYLINWSKKNDVILSILRPSLIAGNEPLGTLGAMISGIKNNRYVNISHGKARKSIVMAQDVADLVPKLMNKGGIYNLSDGYHPSFQELSLLIAKQLDKKAPNSIPYPLAKLLAGFGDCLGSYAPINSKKLSKMVNTLTFSNKKAVSELNWKPLNVLENFKI